MDEYFWKRIRDIITKEEWNELIDFVKMTDKESIYILFNGGVQGCCPTRKNILNQLKNKTERAVAWYVQFSLWDYYSGSLMGKLRGD